MTLDDYRRDEEVTHHTIQFMDFVTVRVHKSTGEIDVTVQPGGYGDITNDLLAGSADWLQMKTWFGLMREYGDMPDAFTGERDLTLAESSLFREVYAAVIQEEVQS